MTPHQIQLVRSSFAKLAPVAAEAAQLFYANLFNDDPSLRRLFRGDMAAQGERLMTMIGAAVSQLELRSLGARHAGYGVRDEHYATVGGALLRTLEQGLGEAFTPEVRSAWAAMYDLISRTMIEAAAAVEQQAV